MSLLFKVIFSSQSYDLINAACNQQSAGVNRLAVEDGKPVMSWLDHKQGELIAFKPRMDKVLAERAEAAQEFIVASTRLNGGVNMAISFGLGIGLENFAMKSNNDLQSMATSLSPKLAEVDEAPAKELKHFLDVAAKDHLRAKANLDAATEKVKAHDEEWVALSNALKRLIRMAKALQTSAGLAVTKRKKKASSPKPLPDSGAGTPAPGAPSVVAPTPAVAPAEASTNESTPGPVVAPAGIVAA